MKVPTVMGCPLWRGRIKRRVAKKHLRELFRDANFITSMVTVGPGDLVLDCSWFNVRVAKVEPVYRRVGKNGFVLVDVDIENDRGGSCSFVHCGVEPARSREDILRHWEESVAHWRSVGDPWRFAARYEFTTVDTEGKAVIDHDGYRSKYGDE